MHKKSGNTSLQQLQSHVTNPPDLLPTKMNDTSEDLSVQPSPKIGIHFNVVHTHKFVC